MTPAEFRAIRKRLGLTLEAWGRALGYTGNHIRDQIYKIEHGIAQPKSPDVPVRTARLARMYDLFGIPEEFTAPRDQD